jgi:predicted Zn-dependent protease
MQPLVIEEVIARLEAVLAASPADETELVWLERRRGRAALRAAKGEESVRFDRTVLVRVEERGRVGTYRTVWGTEAELGSAIRQALAQAKLHSPLPGMPHLPGDATPIATPAIHDPEVEALDGQRARRLLQPLARAGEAARLEWCSGSVAVVNARGLRRSARSSGVHLEVRHGRGSGAGWAAAAARRLGDIDAPAIFARARARAVDGDPVQLPELPAPLWLGPEAVATLLRLLNRSAFTAHAYRDGTSFLREHLGVQVFDRKLTLVDDATDSAGLPFPFDLEGTAKRPVEIVAAGTPRTPALDQRHAAMLGLQPTAHASGGDDARAENLFLRCGESGNTDLAAAAAGGIFGGWLEHPEVHDPKRVQFRALLRGARRVENGTLGGPLPDLLWEDSLLRVFSALEAVGSEAARLRGDDLMLGGVVTPAVVVTEVRSLRPAATLPAA